MSHPGHLTLESDFDLSLALLPGIERRAHRNGAVR
jgi:hypothetical protein